MKVAARLWVSSAGRSLNTAEPERAAACLLRSLIPDSGTERLLLQVVLGPARHPLTDEIRQAIEAHIERKRSQGALAAKAGAVLEDIEREATARRSTIAALFGDEPPTPAAGTAATGRRSRAKGGEDSTS